MKYGEFKKILDKYFDDNEEIYPHAGGNCVVFYKIYHGQRGGLIESDPNKGEWETISFERKAGNKENDYE